MGNEKSQLNGLEIEEKSTEVTDFWTHYQATISDTCRYFSLKCDGSVSVFKGETIISPLWSTSSPLEKFSNNLLKYRHPCILKYISAWQQKSTFHLATEYIQPLSQVISTQTPLQICIGLNNILRALVFLHEQAGMSHNNVCLSAIYVTGDGQWKLGGLQYLCPFSELTPAYLKQARIHRYDKAVDPNEERKENALKVDQYGFAILVEDVLKKYNDEEVPHLTDFKKYCVVCLQNQDSNNRPKLSDVLLHNFFNHEFISIYKFLNFLPLKTEEEKSQFFSNILKNLKCYDEETVAKQFSGLLLSRLTMLDQTARKDVLPYILKPKNDRLKNVDEAGFFSLHVYKEHVKPRLLQLYSVRDIQIRMLLLSHFSEYVYVFTHEELSQQILPELLLGIKDIDDNLVSTTLICLSDLVPILGANTVIGGKRTKIFTDGRPNSKLNNVKNIDNSAETKNLKDFSCSEEITNDSDNIFRKQITLHERPTPVGEESIEEDIVETNIKKNRTDDDWSDWDESRESDLRSIPYLVPNECNVSSEVSKNISDSNIDLFEKSSIMQKAAFEAKKNIIDISLLDIKNQKTDVSKKCDEFDFFADMTPVIEKQKVIVATVSSNVSSKLNFLTVNEDEENEGWGDNWND